MTFQKLILLKGLEKVNFLISDILITIDFKNVGQGDSIIIEWKKNNKKHIGIIDCNITEKGNPVLNHLIQNSITEIEFIVLSHFHYDHFSGMADIFNYCLERRVRTKYFYHSLAPFIGEIYDRIFKSQKINRGAARFIETYDHYNDLVGDCIPINCHLEKLNLTDGITLSFLAPEGKTYDIMAKQLKRKVNKIITTNADINKLASIICIERNNECVILTSDAVKNSFRKITKKINNEVILVQAPHHGSFKSIFPKFWVTIKKINKCPSVFSIGYELKIESVEFFDVNNFEIYSTNCVFGISEYFKKTPNINFNPKSICLNNFSVSRKISNNNLIKQFSGDQKFNLFN